VADELDKNSKNCVYVNLLTDSSFTATDYYDAAHLNDIGAKKLSMKIDSLLNEIK
jgi:hypothetical protein